MIYTILEYNIGFINEFNSNVWNKFQLKWSMVGAYLYQQY